MPSTIRSVAEETFSYEEPYPIRSVPHSSVTLPSTSSGDGTLERTPSSKCAKTVLPSLVESGARVAAESAAPGGSSKPEMNDEVSSAGTIDPCFRTTMLTHPHAPAGQMLGRLRESASIAWSNALAPSSASSCMRASASRASSRAS